MESEITEPFENEYSAKTSYVYVFGTDTGNDFYGLDAYNFSIATIFRMDYGASQDTNDIG